MGLQAAGRPEPCATDTFPDTAAGSMLMFGSMLVFRERPFGLGPPQVGLRVVSWVFALAAGLLCCFFKKPAAGFKRKSFL